MKIENIAISQLRPDPRNARAHPEKNISAIVSSLKKFGQQKPIVVGLDLVVIAGNGTLTAAKKLGWETIDVVKTDLKGSDRKAFALADNRTGELAEWDDMELRQALEELRLDDFDLPSLHFDDEKEEPGPDSEPASKTEKKKTIILCPNCLKEIEI